MYCRTCGSKLDENAEVCTECGCKPLAGKSYCQNCGVKTLEQQELCTQCGVQLKSATSGESKKPISMIQAILIIALVIAYLILMFAFPPLLIITAIIGIISGKKKKSKP